MPEQEANYQSLVATKSSLIVATLATTRNSAHTTKANHWSLRPMHNSKNDVSKEETTQCRRHHPIHGSKVSPRDNLWRVELYLGDAFKKGTALKALPSLALANTKSKISLGSAPETSSQQPTHRADHLQNPHRRHHTSAKLELEASEPIHPQSLKQRHHVETTRDRWHAPPCTSPAGTQPTTLHRGRSSRSTRAPDQALPTAPDRTPPTELEPDNLAGQAPYIPQKEEPWSGWLHHL
jgi:hypothetical protein